MTPRARPVAVSAGVLVCRGVGPDLEFLLVHPGGPFWRGKDVAAWSIPKGLAEEGEDLLAAARREFQEELGLAITTPLTPLSPQRQPGGKTVQAWMTQADLDLAAFRSNSFEMEWPRGSGRMRSFPEVDRAAYVPAEEALIKIHRGQLPILVEARQRLGG
ncbi:NUDIX domain-containing protein [Phenylobacterium sp.]|uniref:NUDIX domain-containing protein n=1 Tax=Phenylobacterium sp. TaxID=1871053 RepID=UPI002715EBFF|nr:NUDIX domain-containing protein [Phenylobacterium sp.]MDO8380203.1 NUDIX domain-containing protein [Phenylobacterium sp.]